MLSNQNLKSVTEAAQLAHMFEVERVITVD